MQNFYRKALGRVFGGVSQAIRQGVVAPAAGFVGGALNKDLPGTIKNLAGGSSLVGGATYGLGEKIGRGAGYLGKKSLKAGQHLIKGGFDDFAGSIPQMQDTWRRMTVEAPSEPLGRMLRPSLQHTLALGITGAGIAGGLSSYNISNATANSGIYDTVPLPQASYSGRSNRSLHESTYGLVQALNTLR